MNRLSIVLAQLNPVVGDIPGNTRRVIAALHEARDKFAARLVIFPELVLCGYPPEDLLLRPSIQTRIARALRELEEECEDITVVLGYPWREKGALYNMAGVIENGKLIAQYAKNCLPNYQVFDEKRYFEAGSEACVLDLCGIRTALTVCEDIWDTEPMAQAKAAGARLMVNINASPFHKNKQLVRQRTVAARACEGGMPVIYVNQVGGQDELVFDGGSMVVDASGELCFQAQLFVEQLYGVELKFDDSNVQVVPQKLAPMPDIVPSIYEALVVGVRDYVNKNGFSGVVLGLSGGIDSALTLAVAVDALGADRVEAVMMPFRYTSQMSLDDAEEEARLLGVNYIVIGIEPIYDAFCAALEDEFSGTEQDKTEENIQARARGVLLMAISNKKGYLVLTTGNKSEMAVGYATLYGDMAGGLDVLKDVPKMMVFELCRYRNEVSSVIPESVITRPPSAELAPNQTDEDSLPPYEILDQILELYIEQDVAAQDIIDRGFADEDVNRVVRMVDLNEYKRRQAAVGIRITEKGFGRDRRYPITNGWRPGD
ncbi:MAG: NAD+ synthase [Gammaproteobacteria bacterium]|nr:MAG: NAD+ synthase [Gammaproteobacteria bacterium]RLA54804.1 MAG: NAD+ synthase [Gammaproteobacteria bacterium]